MGPGAGGRCGAAGNVTSTAFMPRGLPVSPELAATSRAWSKLHPAHKPHCGRFLKNLAPRREIPSYLNRLKTTLHLRTLVIFYKTQNTLLHLPPDNRGLNLCPLPSAPEERLWPAPAIPADSTSEGADALNQRPAHGRKEHSEALGGTRVAKALLGSILGAPPWL